MVHGGLSREQRRAALAAFPSAGVLLATDAAGEGLNLHEHCRTVINLELPWNPMRLEQRIGRVDRIGQRRRVHAFHLVAEDAGEARLLDRLSLRVSRAGARVGAPNPLAGRPAWTEDMAARLIVLQDESPPAPADTWSPPPVPLTRLRCEGEQESARVGSMRSIAAGGGASPAAVAIPSGTVFVARTRRNRMRAELRGRNLAVFRSTLLDGAGRTVATRIVAALCGSTRSIDGAIIDPRLYEVARALDAAATWHLESVDAHTAMMRRLIERTRAIAESTRASLALRQPGLFDRRTEQAWLHESESSEAARAAAIERSTRAELGVALHLSGTEPLLVLCPDAKVTRG